MKRTRTVLLLLALAVLGGCQCIAGLGRDMEAAATWTQGKLDGGFQEPPP